MVWSDNDAVIADLSPVMEYLESCTKRSATDVLKKVDSILETVRHRNKASFARTFNAKGFRTI